MDPDLSGIAKMRDGKVLSFRHGENPSIFG
jgi:hypothetical protein